MEHIVANPSWNKTVQVNDPKLRMPTRPIPNARAESFRVNDSSKRPRRRGKAVEDHGTSFAKSSSEGRKKPGSTSTRRQDAPDHDSDSDDELDMFSSHHGSDMEVSLVKEVNKDPSTDSGGINLARLKRSADVLKTLKFTKTKRPEDDKQPGNSSSQPIGLKENGTKDASGGGKSSSPSRPVHTAQTTVRRARSPLHAPSKRSQSPNRRRSQSQAPKVTRENDASENSRPKPRPVGARKASVQQSAQAISEVLPLHDKQPGSPPRRMTVSGPRAFPSIGLSPPQTSKSMDLAKQPAPQALKKPKQAQFLPLSPHHSPRRPSEFPSLEPLRSHEPPVGKKAAGKRSVSEKVVKPKPADFPMPSPPSGSKKGGMGEVKNKRVSKRVVVSSDESDGHESEAASSLKAQPFPMSIQVLDSIGSPSIAGPSSLRKRSPSGSDDRRKNKKRKDADSDIQVIANSEYEEEDTLTTPPVDPRTLCPYCDTPLPASPTPLLKRLLASTEKKSHREPRPDNPLGRNAPFAVFIAVCQRHRFESEILPQAERRGWPKVIDWTELGKRVHRMKAALRTIIDDGGGTDANDDYEGPFGDEGNSHPRAQCVFWKEVMTEVKQKGSRVVAGVRGQFANFEKAQPGYYGELGSVIIHQTLYDLFPPTTIDPDLVAPLTPNEFVQRILVPEVGVRLIIEDMGLDGSKVEEAVRILRESANYGVAMFPADEGEEGEGVPKGAKLGVADSIVMERAKKRRKELEADEQEKEEQMEMEMEEKAAEKQRKVSRKLGKTGLKNGKEKESDVEPPAQAPPARPRPRPVGKNASMTSVRTADVEMATEIPCTGEGDTDVEVEQSFHSHTKNQPSRNPNDLLIAHVDPTLRKRKVAKAPADTDIDLCTTSSDSDGQWDLGRMTRGRKLLARSRSIAASQNDLDPPPSSRTSSAYHSGVVYSDSEEATPKPPSRPGRASPEVPLSGQTPPLLRARERKATSSRLTAEESHSWLLSDTTHSSLESITYK